MQEDIIITKIIIPLTLFNKLWFLILAILFVYTGCAKGQNMALGESYILSARPNYDLSASPTDSTSLTDGVYSSGKKTFWVQQTTVGWKEKEFVKVTIDLGEIEPVGSVLISTAKREKSGVYYPWGIYVFLSNDKYHYTYEGKAALKQSTTTKKDKRAFFELSNINKYARYVTIAVKPRGKNHFLFIDEIEIHKALMANDLEEEKITKQKIRNVADSLRSVEDPMIQFITAFKSKNQDEKKIKLFSARPSVLDIISMNISKLKDLRSKVLKQRVSQLYARFQTSFIVEKYNPWSKVLINYIPKNNPDSLSYTKIVLKGGSLYGSFMLTNLMTSQQIFQFKTLESNAFKIYKVGYIGVKEENRIADPLLPVLSSDTLQPGVSKLYLFSLNNIQDNSTLHFTIASPHKKLTITVHARTIDINSPFQLNAVNWGYLTYPMLQDIKLKAMKDMKKHHINTFVVPPSVIPNLNSQNFKPLKNYLYYIPKGSKILLFMNYKWSSNKLGNSRTAFMSAKWKKMFEDWYQKIKDVIQAIGFPISNIYLYPYDEVKKSSEIHDFRQFAQWAQKNFSTLQLYATITSKVAAEALYRNLDIAQFYIGNNLFKKYNSPGTANWIYAILGSSYLLSPYHYYRLLAWKAFLYDLQGIGFWNYAGNKQKTFINSPILSYKKNHAVIYNNKSHNIISSRRWEAFKLGMEDYKVLKLFEKYYGEHRANTLVKSVVNNPNDVGKAAEVRCYMLKKIKNR